jgi:uncharacterized protein YjiS (DUF1127 family)
MGEFMGSTAIVDEKLDASMQNPVMPIMSRLICLVTVDFRLDCFRMYNLVLSLMVCGAEWGSYRLLRTALKPEFMQRLSEKTQRKIKKLGLSETEIEREIIRECREARYSQKSAR